MNALHLEVLRRLEHFQLDSAEATLPFSGRLARENHWSGHYTQRVIAEYKRFAFLAVAAGHPVSPSEDVDQAWHLHLTYTVNYWKIFCPGVLGQPLHHQPTQGGSSEQAKFQNWYERTLESYAAHFGEEPPPDIWPPAETRRTQSHDFVRVDRAHHWVLPKPRLRPARKPLAAAALIAMAALCTGWMVAQGIGPFDWRGPDFLKFHLLLGASGLGLAAWLRWKLRIPVTTASQDHSDLEPYAMAYLHGGRILAVNSAIANLANRHLLKFDSKEKKLETSGLIEADATALEQAIHHAARKPGGTTIADARLAAKPVVEGFSMDLQERGLVMAEAPAKTATWLPLVVAGMAPFIGAIKIGIGLSRGKPVAFLVGLTITFAVIALAGFARRPLRSRRGDAVLAQLQARHHRANRLRGRLSAVSPVEFATAVGLFGLVALDGTVLADMKGTLQPPQSSGSCGSSCGGGCGGGGCGGGCGGCGGCGS